MTTQKENGTFVSYTYEGMPVTVNVPYTTMNEFTGVSDYFYSATIQGDKSLDSQKVADKVVSLLEKRHQCAGEDYFQVQSFQDIMSSMNQMLDMVTAFISFVAGISLLVGGIGVMNIMLVSITERTREIGVRMALGAKRRTIRMQFVIEAIMLCLIGGIIGILIGIGIGALLGKVAGFVIQNMYSQYANYIIMTVHPSVTAIMLSLFFSMLTGVFFGYYPANKASKMEVIDALRYE